MSVLSRPLAQPGRVADALLGVLAIAWAAEALGRTSIPLPVLTSLIYAGFSVRFLICARDLTEAIVRRWWVLLFPVVCLLSAFWSSVPQTTAVSAVQLLFTCLIGLHLGCRFGVRGAAILACWGLGLAVVASAVIYLLDLSPVFAPGGGYLGIFLQKNGLGQRCVLFILLALLVMCQATGRTRGVLLLGIFLAVWMLLLSQSVTSQLVAPAAVMVGLVAVGWCSGQTPRRVTAVVCACSLGCLASWLLLEQVPLIDEGLRHFGKDRDLTGRVLLWQVALARAGEVPVFGLGYMAYWQAPEFAQEVILLRALNGADVAVFHNFLLEVLVAVGLFGMCSMAALLAGVLRALWSHPDAVERIWLLLFFGVCVFFSALGASLYRPHEVVLLLLVALATAVANQRAVLPGLGVFSRVTPEGRI